MSDPEEIPPLVTWALRWNVSPDTMRAISERLAEVADFAAVLQDADEGRGERLGVAVGDLGLRRGAIADLVRTLRGN